MYDAEQVFWMKHFFLLDHVMPFVICRIISSQKTNSVLCSWQKNKQNLSYLVMPILPESFNLAMVAFLYGWSLINSISIQYAKVIKTFLPFAKLVLTWLLGFAWLNDFLVTTAQTSSRIFSVWFGLSSFVEAGSIRLIPSACY